MDLVPPPIPSTPTPDVNGTDPTAITNKGFSI